MYGRVGIGIMKRHVFAVAYNIVIITVKYTRRYYKHSSDKVSGK